MQLGNDLKSFQRLYEAVNSFYGRCAIRHWAIFEDLTPEQEDKYYVRFLVDRKHVVEYAVVTDRGFQLSGVSLAIGPRYFGPADFWSYENSKRFALEATTEAIEQNLHLLDEFFSLTKLASAG